MQRVGWRAELVNTRGMARGSAAVGAASVCDATRSTEARIAFEAPSGAPAVTGGANVANPLRRAAVGLRTAEIAAQHNIGSWRAFGCQLSAWRGNQLGGTRGG